MADDVAQSARFWPRHIWHHAMHEARGESLIFLRFAFAQTYDRAFIKRSILECLGGQGVRSMIAYELFGFHDLLVRIWVPEQRTADQIEDVLLSQLGPHGLRDAEIFTVSYPVRHWPFARKDAALYW